MVISSGKVRFTGLSTKQNIAFRGEDVKAGDVVLAAGRKIRAQSIAVMASVGHISVLVSKKPKVGIISSGSELVEPAEIPGLSQIRNSNSSQLMAQTEESGATGTYYGIAMDDEAATLSIVSKAISENDMVIITGGVSMGDFDFVTSVLEKAGTKILFTRVAVQPGKPTTFGVHDKVVVFGLPGNPVSSFIQFEMLVKPLIYNMMDFNWQPVIKSLPLGEKYSRRSSDRMAFIPVKITDGGDAVPVEYHGSAHITALPDADGIVAIPVGKLSLEKGEMVEVRLI
jgi:molybdopterin molybdotransferase